MTAEDLPPTFTQLLQSQVSAEFAASQQYVALAVWFDSRDLPQLATLFYRQAVEERNHAMMMVRYLLDRDVAPVIPGVAPVRNDFREPVELIRLALHQEKEVTEHIERLFKAARDEGDFLGEQFVLWFLKEQVEEVAAMQSLLTVTERAGSDLFRLEEYVDREGLATGERTDSTAPATAGGAL
jgi:bacterioferritin B